MLKGFIILLFISYNCICQTQLKGKVIDVDTKTAIPYALIKVKNSNDSTISLCDSLGNYKINIKKSGIYNLTTIALNYELRTDSIDFRDEIFFNIFLKSKTMTLEEVIVTSQKKIIEKKGSTTIVNFNETILANIGSLTFLEKFIPNVQLTSHLIVSNKEALLYVDGRLINLDGELLGNYLISIPSTTVDKIEIIQNPSSKYDSEGKAIISITTLRNKEYGLLTNIGIGFAQAKYFRNNENILIGYKQKKYSLQVSLVNDLSNVYSYSNTKRKIYSSNVLITDNESGSRNNKINQIKLLGEYLFTEKNTTNIFYQKDFNKDKNNSESFLIKTSKAFNQENIYTKFISKKDYDNLNYGINNIHAFKNKSKFNLNYEYGHFTKDQTDFVKNVSDLKKTIGLEIPLLQEIKINSFKSSYEKNINNSSIEVGFLYRVSNIDSKYNIKINDRDSTDIFIDHYKEKLGASYIDIASSFKTIDFKVGLRVEKLVINENLYANQNYFKLFPNFEFTIPLKKHTLGFGFSQKITRTNFNDITKQIWYINPYNYFAGNSDLKPTFINYSELNYNYDNTIFALLFVSSNKGEFVNLPILDNADVSIIKKVNMKKYTLVNLDLSYDKNITNNYRLNFGVSPYYIINDNSNLEGQLNSKQLSYFIFINNYLSLKKGLKLDLTSYYITPQNVGITYSYPYYQTSFGIQKSFFSKKMDIRLNISDLFNNFTYKTRVVNKFQEVNKFQKIESRIFSINFLYRFTEKSFQKRDINSTINKEVIRIIN